MRACGFSCLGWCGVNCNLGFGVSISRHPLFFYPKPVKLFYILYCMLFECYGLQVGSGREKAYSHTRLSYLRSQICAYGQKNERLYTEVSNQE